MSMITCHSSRSIALRLAGLVSAAGIALTALPGLSPSPVAPQNTAISAAGPASDDTGWGVSPQSEPDTGWGAPSA
ncbi:hypothetical protein GCM10010103_75820 [Streptomyces paradoxus]|uniref:Uncharacterized protein n=1 Tax=Streptomyces paradoxus TaxID=66375 RepID=A0A7W9TJ81_9ACTN|nr:hypothetical protein [Streptomyces paradoxus]